jgi:3-hydroxyacyl-[acyl-carrier-protein] dehydratase
MPGVCMMQVIKELTEEVLKVELFLQTSTNIKFMAKINPELNPDLVLKIDFTEEGGIIKLKNSTFFEETLALKLNAKYKIVS